MSHPKIEPSTGFPYRVPLLEIEIDAVRVGGQTFVEIDRACVELNLDVRDEIARIREACWATITSVAVAGQGRSSRKADVIPLPTFFMWLALLDAAFVPPEIRPRLARLQEEAAEILGSRMN